MAGDATGFAFTPAENKLFPKALRDEYGIDIDDDGKEVEGGQAPPATETPAQNEDAAGDPAGDAADNDAGQDADDTAALPAPAAAPQTMSPEIDARFREMEQRFSTLQGKYNAEVPRLNDKVRALTEENAQLAAENATLRQASDSKPSTPKAAPPAATATLTEQVLIDVYGLTADEVANGVDTYEGVRKIVRVELEHALSGVNEKVGAVQKDVSTRQLHEYLAERNRLIPDFATVNEDPAFHDWLDTYDDARCATYRDLAQSAIQSLNARSLAAIFNLFRKPASQAAETTPSAAPAAAAKPASGSNVMPQTRGGGTPQPTSTGKRTYTSAEYERMTSEAVRLRNTNPKRAAELEKELDAAEREGRVRG